MYYQIVTKNPVCKFYYKGSHSHPVRRTILIIESNNRFVRGYELREGSSTRNLKDAPVKTYLKRKIAKESDLGANKHRTPGLKVSTLKRMKLLDLVKVGA